MIYYIDSAESISESNLSGFFVGWANPPSPQMHLKLLRNSHRIVLAINADNDVIGFITAITDGVLSAYIPLLEVLPEYRGQGIGRELVKRILEKLSGLYMVDLLCDQELQPFYKKFSMIPGFGMMMRNYDCQSGIEP